MQIPFSVVGPVRKNEKFVTSNGIVTARESRSVLLVMLGNTVNTFSISWSMHETASRTSPELEYDSGRTSVLARIVSTVLLSRFRMTHSVLNFLLPLSNLLTSGTTKQLYTICFSAVVVPELTTASACCHDRDTMSLVTV